MSEKKPKRHVLEPGTRVLNNRYQILKVIHTSGMANVYLAVDSQLNKHWCMKQILLSEAGKNMVEYRSLLQEANIMKGLNHPNIPRITTMEEDKSFDSLFIIMDYVEGVSAKEHVKKYGCIEQKRAVHWMKQVARVMMYLHVRENPIVYRDMKPENIMIMPDFKNVRVLDFGISDIITPDNQCVKEALGTKGYAAPEQKKRGVPYDIRCDIYAFGRTLFNLLTGLSPVAFKGDLPSIRETNPGLSEGLDIIIKKCTEYDPEDRYQSFGEVLYSLQNFERIDSNYINQAKKKIIITVSMFATSVLMITTSFIPMYVESRRVNAEYESALASAKYKSDMQGYINASQIDPDRVDAYEGMIDCILEDSIFSPEEETLFLDVITPNLRKLQWRKGYSKLAYDIGKMYWFYYSGEDGEATSAKWFKEATDRLYKLDDAQVLYYISSFKKDVNQAIAEESDRGMYKEYWNNLMIVKNEKNEDSMNLQINYYIVDAVHTYAYALRLDGVSEEDMKYEIDRIRSFASEYSPQSDKASSIYDSLNTELSDIDGILADAFSKGESSTVDSEVNSDDE